MTFGAGKYNNTLSLALESIGATNGALIVHDGTQGGGFAVQMEAQHMMRLPNILTDMAKAIRSDLAGKGLPPLNENMSAIVDEDGERFRMLRRMSIDEESPEAKAADAYIDAKQLDSDDEGAFNDHEFDILIEIIDHVRTLFPVEKPDGISH
jgi:hypothetical protein